MVIQVSHILNFMSCHGYCISLVFFPEDVSYGDSSPPWHTGHGTGYAAEFTYGKPVMPEKKHSCGMYQTAVKSAAERLFQRDPEIAKKWAEETLKCLYKDKT